MSDTNKQKPKIVCAAIEYQGTVICSARHFDKIMHQQVRIYNNTKINHQFIKWEQGFIDQFCNFYNRTDAMKVVKESGQPFNAKRNGSPDNQLFSEGLY